MTMQLFFIASMFLSLLVLGWVLHEKLNTVVLCGCNEFQELNAACDTVILYRMSVSSSNWIVLIDF